MACTSLGFRSLSPQIPVSITSSSSSSKRAAASCSSLRARAAAAAASPPLPPLNPKDPFLSKLASIAAANPDLVAMPPPSNPEIPPFLDLFDSPKLMATPAQVERSVSYNEHRPRKPPPDLPSLLLHGRIVYIGMQVLEANERKVGKVRFKSINNGSPDVDTKGLNCLLSTKVVKRKKQKEMEPDSNGVQIANRVEDDRSTVRAYLDSTILQSQLQNLSEHGSLKGSHSSSRSTLEVPIFWFIHKDPLFVDKHYQAKALSDMIIVVQSESSSWESHLQCNGRSLLWDLRNPIKAAIAATAEHLAGLLPLHLVYSQAHETAIEDWTWSVGCNPLSITSQGWHLSRFQLDVIARSYIITALEESIQAVNAAINLLVRERTTSQGFKLFKSHERGIVEKYNSIVSLWRRISTISSGLRYGDAMRLLSLLEDASKGFTDHVNSTLSALHPVHCTRERKVDVEVDLTTVPAFLVVFAILWFVLRPRRPKPKIN